MKYCQLIILLVRICYEGIINYSYNYGKVFLNGPLKYVLLYIQYV